MAQNSSGLPGIENLPIYVAYFLGGFVIGGSNLVILVALGRYEALRSNKVYVLIMAQSLADSINMLAYTLGGIRRSLLIFSGIHNTMITAWQCAQVPHTITWSFSTLLANVMLYVVSMDRLICVMSPLRYIGLTYKYTMTLAASAYLYSIVFGATGLFWAYSTRDEQLQTIGAKCIGHNVFPKVHPLYDLHFNQASILWAFLSVCIYVAVWIIYKRQNSQVSPDNQGQQHQMEHQRKFTKSLGISCLCSFFLFIVPRQLGNIANKFGSRSVAMAFWTSANLNPFANVFIYITRHEEIRQALKGLFTCKHMPADVKTWKANRQASKAPKKGIAAARTNEQHPNQLAVQEL